jgi:hypothetical protein
LNAVRKNGYPHDAFYLGYKFCLLSETAGLRFPARYDREFSSFNVSYSSKTSSASYASAVDVIYRAADVFGMETVFFLICIVGGGVQTGSTQHVGHLLAYYTYPE